MEPESLNSRRHLSRLLMASGSQAGFGDHITLYHIYLVSIHRYHVKA